MKEPAVKLLVVLAVIVIMINPPLVFGVLGPEGHKIGLIIDDALGVKNFRGAVFGLR